MPSIYIHFPFCTRKCSYCNFYSSTRCVEIPAYSEALYRELSLRVCEWDGRPADTLYFGGGTPSLLPPSEIQNVIRYVTAHYGLVPDAEITLEANPNQLTEEYFRALKETQVNRLSIGIQSFSDAVLEKLRRTHTAAQAEKALDLALRHGFRSISADLIYGLPGNTLEQWERDVRRLSFLPHLSCYQLTLEEGSLLHMQWKKGMVRMPSEEETEEQRKFLWGFLADAGFTHYEVSSFCRGDAWSRHNCAYWKQEPYLGFGPGAHSFVPHRRQWNFPDVSLYCREISALPSDAGWESLEGNVFGMELLTPEMEYEEYLMTSLRTCWGCDLDTVRDRWGEQALPHIRRQLGRYPDSFYTLSEKQLVLTESGLLSADGIAADLFL